MPTRFHADTVLPCDSSFAVHRPGVVDVDDDGRLTWVGPAAEAPPSEAAFVPLRGLLMPGLINTHCHSPMALLRGAGEDLPLLRWLEEVIWPREAGLTAEDVYWGMTLAAAELLRGGVTTSVEMYFHSEAIIDAVRDAGSRAIVTPTVMEAPGMEHLGPWATQLEEHLALAAATQDPTGRVEVGIAAHGAYTLPLEALRAIGAAAAEHDLLAHIHVAESRGEAAELEAAEGKSVPAILADLGFLDAPRVLTAHAVWLSDDDLEHYAAHDVAVAHCPQSNTKLASGIARVTAMLERGITVGVATDGPASNNNLDLWEEVRLTPLLQRVATGDATAVPAATALSLPTAGGAAAIGREDLGVLEAGRRADLVHVDTDHLAFTPVTADADVVAHLLWSAGREHVRDVWVGGRQVVADGVCTTVEVGRARAEVTRRARRLAGLV